jgi:hypothetical protein
MNTQNTYVYIYNSTLEHVPTMYLHIDSLAIIPPRPGELTSIMLKMTPAQHLS